MYTTEKMEIGNIPVVLVETDKFKTVTIRVQFRSPMKRERVTARNLLSRMMVKRTGKFKSESELLNYLAHHYGAHLTSHVSKKGTDNLVTFSIEFINSKFVKEDLNMLAEMCSLLRDALTAPAGYGEGDQEFFEREKRLYMNSLYAMRDNKAQKSFEALLGEMFKDEDYKYLSHGVVEDIESLTLLDIKEEHQRMMESDEAVILAVGTFDDNISDELGTIARRGHRIEMPYAAYPYKDIDEVTRKVETQKVEQAKLNLGFRAALDDAYERMAFNVLNQMFGGTASSYLFRNIREEKSLAYQIHSQVDMKNGYMFVIGGVDVDKVDITEEAVLHELDRFRQGDFKDDFVAEIKNMMSISREERKDKPQGLLALIYNRILTGDAPSWDETLGEVDRDSIVEVANKIKLDTVYTLTGEN